jgi:hypothetical protein
MSGPIEDGLGRGYAAGVGHDNRLLADVIQRSFIEQAAVFKGDAYNVNSGVVTLTSANKSAVFWLKNNDPDKLLVIESIIYVLGASTGGVGTAMVTVLRNPTGGTIADNALAPAIPGANRNFGSTTVMNADIYKGVEGDTLIAGTTFIDARPLASVLAVVPADSTTLPQGTCLGVEVTPPASNTSMAASVIITCHMEAIN